MWVSWLLFLPISLPRSMAALAKFSLTGLVAIVAIVVCVLGVAPGLPEGAKGAQPIVMFKLGGLASAVSVLSFAYLCQHSLLLSTSRPPRARADFI